MATSPPVPPAKMSSGDVSGVVEEIIKLAENHNISLNINQLRDLEIHASMLLTWNAKMNLTRIREPKEIARRHFLEGLCAGNLLQERGLRGPLVDLGSGNGFPGVPMAVVCRQARPLTLVESSEKKATFLRALLRELGWTESGVEVRRIEDSRDLADLACGIFTSRGVALSRLLSEGLPFLQAGAHCVLFASEQVLLKADNSPIPGLVLEQFLPLEGRETGILLLRKI